MNYRRLPTPTIQMMQAAWGHTPRGLPENACWAWSGGRTKGGKGYGLLYCCGTWSATRVVYYLVNGVDPYTLNVCHTCDNPPCVNPAHLGLATQQENIWQAIERDRFHGRPRALTEDQVDLAVTLRAQGHSTQHLADALHVTYQTLHKALARRVFA